MTPFDAALAGVLALGLAGVGGWACYVAATFQRPAWRAGPPLAFATWWVGAALLATLLLALAGSVVGLFATAALRLLR